MGVTGPCRVVVDIGELVLDGFPAADRDLVAASFRRELTRLLSGPATPASTVDDVRDTVTSVSAPAANTPSRRLGEHLARSVHAALGVDGDR